MRLISVFVLGLSVLFGTFSENSLPTAEFYMSGTILSVGEEIGFFAKESPYAEGEYILVVDKNTLYMDALGEKIERCEIIPGDNVKVIYSGQVMLSLPPRVYARRVIKL